MSINKKKVKIKQIKKTVRPTMVVKKIEEVEIEFFCPMRGLVKQKVKVKKIKAIKYNPQHFTSSKEDSEVESLDKDNPIYGTEIEETA